MNPWEMDLNAAAEREERAHYSPVESASMGAGQGLTAGYADELAGTVSTLSNPLEHPMDYSIIGGLKNVYDFATEPEKREKMLHEYEAARDDWRKKFAAAEEDNPLSYLGGDVVGTVAGSVVPGSAAMRGLAGTAKGAAALSNVGGRIAANTVLGGIAGAVQGSGRSEADDADQLLLDTLKGGATGAVASGLGSGGTEALSGIAGYGKNLLSKFPNAVDFLKKIEPIWAKKVPPPTVNIGSNIAEIQNSANKLQSNTLNDFVASTTKNNPEGFSDVLAQLTGKNVTPSTLERMRANTAGRLETSKRAVGTGANTSQAFGALSAYLTNAMLPNKEQEEMKKQREREIQEQFANNMSNTYNKDGQ